MELLPDFRVEGCIFSFTNSLIDHVITSSERRRGATTLVLSKLEAHIARNDPSYQGLTVDIEAARLVIEEILKHPQRIVAGLKTIDIYGSQGRAVRLHRETLEFQTFLEATKATR